MAFMTRSRLSRWLLFYLAMLLVDAAAVGAVVVVEGLSRHDRVATGAEIRRGPKSGLNSFIEIGWG